MWKYLIGGLLVVSSADALAASSWTDFGVRTLTPRFGSAAKVVEAAPMRSSINLTSVASIGAQWGRVTSTYRSTAHNRAVGGVRNSYHLSGRAIDIARRAGVRHSQIAAAFRNAGYYLIESLDEGDHSHFAFGSASSRMALRVASSGVASSGLGGGKSHGAMTINRRGPRAGASSSCRERFSVTQSSRQRGRLSSPAYEQLVTVSGSVLIRGRGGFARLFRNAGKRRALPPSGQPGSPGTSGASNLADDTVRLLDSRAQVPPGICRGGRRVRARAGWKRQRLTGVLRCFMRTAASAQGAGHHSEGPP